MLHIQISLGTKFFFKLIFWTKLTQKGYFQSKKRERANYRRILHIRINLGSKFQLQETTLIFDLWSKT